MVVAFRVSLWLSTGKDDLGQQMKHACLEYQSNRNMLLMKRNPTFISDLMTFFFCYKYGELIMNLSKMLDKETLRNYNNSKAIFSLK